MENTIEFINKKHNFPKVIDCSDKSADKISEFIDIYSKNYNILGINLSEQKYNKLLEKYKYLKYSYLGKVLSIINFTIRFSYEKVGIVCFDENNVQLFEELFDCLIMFGLRAKRIYYFDNNIEINRFSGCNYVLMVENENYLLHIKNIPIINISNTLNTILLICNNINEIF